MEKQHAHHFTSGQLNHRVLPTAKRSSSNKCQFLSSSKKKKNYQKNVHIIHSFFFTIMEELE